MGSSSKIRKFLASWDMNGLEVLYDLTAWEKREVWNILKGTPTDNDAPRLNMMILRARVNPQRQYEIYIFETSDLDYDTVSDTFKTSPQFMADFIRKNGTQVYSDYAPGQRVIS